MCTIGVVFEGEDIHTFKQCDLIPSTTFYEPSEKDGLVLLSREGGHMWAAVNRHGVAFVAADSYTTTSAEYSTTDEQVNALFEAYERAAAKPTAAEAADCLADFYTNMNGEGPFPAPDISMFAGWADAEKTQPQSILLEYMPNPYNRRPVRRIVRAEGTFVSTNNFRLQPNSVAYPANHSTYLRLGRAQQILQQTPTREGVIALLRDQYYGATELSICRQTDWPGVEFRTQATALFSCSPDGSVGLLYQINGNPRSNPLRTYGVS